MCVLGGILSDFYGILMRLHWENKSESIGFKYNYLHLHCLLHADITLGDAGGRDAYT